MEQIPALVDSLRTWALELATNVGNGAWAQPVVVPTWAAAGVCALLVLLVLGRLFRRGYEPGGGLWRIALLAVVAFVAWRGFETYERISKIAPDRTALADQVGRAITAPAEANPLLACTNGVANVELRAACERTVFAKPEHTAAAVSLVRDRIDLLERASDPDAGLGPDDPRTVRLRRTLESDDFGLVGHALAENEHCRPDNCARLALFKDVSRIRANMEAHTFEGLIDKYATAWSRPPEAAAPAASPGSSPSAGQGAASAQAGESSPAPATPPALPGGEAAPIPAPTMPAPAEAVEPGQAVPQPRPVARPALPQPRNAVPVQPVLPQPQTRTPAPPRAN